MKKKLPTHTGKGFFYTNLEVYRINYSSKFHGSKEKKKSVYTALNTSFHACTQELNTRLKLHLHLPR